MKLISMQLRMHGLRLGEALVGVLTVLVLALIITSTTAIHHATASDLQADCSMISNHIVGGFVYEKLHGYAEAEQLLDNYRNGCFNCVASSGSWYHDSGGGVNDTDPLMGHCQARVAAAVSSPPDRSTYSPRVQQQLAAADAQAAANARAVAAANARAAHANNIYGRIINNNMNAMGTALGYLAEQEAEREQAAQEQAAEDAARQAEADAEAARARQAAAQADARHRAGLSNPFGGDQQLSSPDNPFASNTGGGGAADNPFRTADAGPPTVHGSASPNSRTCKEARIGIVWVLQGDKGARDTFALARQQGLSSFEAVIYAQGHNPHAQAMIRGCSISPQIVASLVGGG